MFCVSSNTDGDGCSLSLWPPSSACMSSFTGGGAPVSRSILLEHAHVSPALLVRDEMRYICHGLGSSTSLRTCLVTGSLLFATPTRGGIILWLPRVLPGFLRWTIVVGSRTLFGLWWRSDMESGTARPDTQGAGDDSAVGDPVPGGSRRSDLTLHSDRLYDLDSSIPDVIGLCAVQPEAAVVKVMSIPDNRCVRVVIPDENVGHGGFHEVLLHDMADADSPYVAVNELGSLRRDWPSVIFIEHEPASDRSGTIVP